jgi:predicted nucleotidyltransferase
MPVLAVVLHPHPTPYPDVNAVLRALESELRTILGPRFLGMYLSGSLAMGDFDESSDIDVLVVTTDVLPEEVVCALVKMHERFSVTYPRWGLS